MSRISAALEGLVLAVALMLAACDSDAGPADVKLGRDVCEMCGMIISDPRFIAELRLADGKLHKFDDVGDAVNWLSSNCKTLAEVKEFWVIDSANGKAWLDARKAFYRGAETPMNYGYGAVAAAGPETIAFDEMRARVAKPQHGCKAAAPPNSGQ